MQLPRRENSKERHVEHGCPSKAGCKTTEFAVAGIRQYFKEVKEGSFPDDGHSYSVNEAEYEKFAVMAANRKQH
jgi:3-methyl-2-oxobutanoate hydroxymethyltransferase